MDQSVVVSRPDLVEKGPILLAVLHQLAADDLGDALASGSGDGHAVGPQFVVDADGVLGRPLHLGHIRSVVGDWASTGPARCCSHPFRIASHVH